MTQMIVYNSTKSVQLETTQATRAATRQRCAGVVAFLLHPMATRQVQCNANTGEPAVQGLNLLCFCNSDSPFST